MKTSFGFFVQYMENEPVNVFKLNVDKFPGEKSLLIFFREKTVDFYFAIYGE